MSNNLTFVFILVAIFVLILMVVIMLIWEAQSRVESQVIEKQFNDIKNDLDTWVNGLSSVSGVSKGQLINMPSSQIEELRIKYHYK